jgi:mRNA-degrading endonuclease toxin of MazEF toxin-antitoxin module
VSPPPLVQQGSVIWAELADDKGFRKVRPAVVVSPAADIAAGKPLRVAAITTRLPQPLPADHVLLSWDPRGRARSGLRKRSAAIASWVVGIPVSAIRQVVGILRPVELHALLAKVASPSPPAPPPAGPGGPPAGSPPTP